MKLMLWGYLHQRDLIMLLQYMQSVTFLFLMEWSRPTQQGEIPTPRAGLAGVTVGENWFIVGSGDNKSGASETVVLNMSTLVWSVVTSVGGRVPLASEGLSLVVGSFNGEDILISFGGYNGH